MKKHKHRSRRSRAINRSSLRVESDGRARSSPKTTKHTKSPETREKRVSRSRYLSRSISPEQGLPLRKSKSRSRTPRSNKFRSKSRSKPYYTSTSESSGDRESSLESKTRHSKLTKSRPTERSTKHGIRNKSKTPEQGPSQCHETKRNNTNEEAQSELDLGLNLTSEEFDQRSVKSDDLLVQEEDDNDIFTTVRKELIKPTDLAPAVAENLAHIAHFRFTSTLSGKDLEQKIKNTKTAENCCFIKPPVLNESLFDKDIGLNRTCRRSDERMENIQILITKAAAAAIETANKLNVFATQAKNNEKTLDLKKITEASNEAIKNQTEILAFLGSAQQSLSQSRKAQLYRVLPREVAPICFDKEIKTGDKLFGEEEELQKKIKDMRIKTRIAAANRNNSNRRFHPFSSVTPKAKPFLGQKTLTKRNEFGQGSRGNQRKRNWRGKQFFKN